MQHIYRSILNFFLLVALPMVSCKKFVEVSPPSTSIVTGNVFNSDANATSALTGIYTQMENSSDLVSLSMATGLLADELTNYSTYHLNIEYYTNTMEAQDVSNPWTDAYNYIYQANAVISGLQNYSGVTSAAKQQLIGEAEFIRAFWYFYLTGCYGSVPLVTTVNYTVNATASRMPWQQIIRQIITDLTNAENLLSTTYVDLTDSMASSDRVRPTKWAAAALLARTYLYGAVYDSAEQQSTLVISGSGGLYTLCSTLDSVFLMNNTEAIWQIPPVQPSGNLATPEGQDFILQASPALGASFNSATISPQLMSSFELGDLRKTHWISEYTPDGVNFYYYPYKYKTYNSSSLVEYSVILRLAEQYLIRAEARAQQGNLSGAIADLNVIRNRSGLASYSGAMDKPSLLTAILHERQVELFTELGHRWFDLNRTSSINSVMAVVTPQKGGSWSSNWVLFPIPLLEITSDPKLKQNPGY